MAAAAAAASVHKATRRRRRAAGSTGNAPTARLKLHVEPGQIPPGGAAAGAHERQYNAPTADNVAVILHAPSDDASLDLIMHPKVDDERNFLHRVSYSHALYDALAFPLLLFKGTPTWHKDFTVPIVGGARRAISLMQFYASMLYVRRSACEMPKPRAGVKRYADGRAQSVVNDSTWFFRGGRLFQQFICTAAARSELKRMSTLATPKMPELEAQSRHDAWRRTREAPARRCALTRPLPLAPPLARYPSCLAKLDVDVIAR
jgi:hypothetical protein